jgi:hypothetical protein
MRRTTSNIQEVTKVKRGTFVSIFMLLSLMVTSGASALANGSLSRQGGDDIHGGLQEKQFSGSAMNQGQDGQKENTRPSQVAEQSRKEGWGNRNSGQGKDSSLQTSVAKEAGQQQQSYEVGIQMTQVQASVAEWHDRAQADPNALPEREQQIAPGDALEQEQDSNCQVEAANAQEDSKNAVEQQAQEAIQQNLSSET